MKRIIASTICALMLVFATSITAPAPAQAEPTGQYYYECISTTGTSYWIWPGQTLRCTNASYLKTYINGSLVNTKHLTPNGTEASITPAQARQAGKCLLAIGATVYLRSPATVTTKYVLGASYASWSIVDSCKAL
jgi:hypothetical protein